MVTSSNDWIRNPALYNQCVANSENGIDNSTRPDEIADDAAVVHKVVHEESLPIGRLYYLDDRPTCKKADNEPDRRSRCSAEHVWNRSATDCIDHLGGLVLHEPGNGTVRFALMLELPSHAYSPRSY